MIDDQHLRMRLEKAERHIDQLWREINKLHSEISRKEDRK